MASHACHAAATVTTGAASAGLPRGRIVLVGNPNVGKSVLFNALTGAYVTVSNYPGTTVEISRGRLRPAPGECLPEMEVEDTPGMYSLLPISEEERVARNLLMQQEPERVLHVVDAKNLERMLSLTLQLIEAGLPLLLVVNLIDESERLGLQIDAAGLERELGIPVVATAAVSGRGLGELRERLAAPVEKRAADPPLRYRPQLESLLAELEPLLGGRYALSRRAMALLLLQGDEEVRLQVEREEGPAFEPIRLILQRYEGGAGDAAYAVATDRQAWARELAGRYMSRGGSRKAGLQEILGRITVNPLTGIPILLAVLYLGLYRFVGVFGAGTLVDFLETRVFEELLNPLFSGWAERFLPWPAFRDLLVGEYGMLSLGLRYAVAIILPIVGTFFLAFSVLEDSGYFPRLALLVDRIFKRIGLNGRAVIPMVLGFGCDTMATMVTRTLETRRERVLATLLLALAIPCSAQLGVILALLAGYPRALVIWLGVVVGVFMLVGLLAARMMPGERPSFYMELPPLRLPRLGNVLIKTYTRMQWYLIEVLPFFLLSSAVIWLGQITGLFQILIRGLKPVMGWIGLPMESAVVFVFGFFRRDYGAAGLYDLQRSGLLSEGQLVVATVTLTLFIPCVAQFAVMLKERGWKTALGIAAFVFPFAFAVGMAIYRLLPLVGMH